MKSPKHPHRLSSAIIEGGDAECIFCVADQYSVCIFS